MAPKTDASTTRAVHATVSVELYDLLAKQAESEERTISVVVTRALRAYLSPGEVARSPIRTTADEDAAE